MRRQIIFAVLMMSTYGCVCGSNNDWEQKHLIPRDRDLISYARAHNSKEIRNLLQSRNPDINAQDNLGNTALMLAVQWIKTDWLCLCQVRKAKENQEEAVKLILEQSPGPNLKIKNKNEQDVLEIAFTSQNGEYVNSTLVATLISKYRQEGITQNYYTQNKQVCDESIQTSKLKALKERDCCQLMRTVYAACATS